MSPEHPASTRFALRLLGLYALVWAAAAIGVRDWPTWALENLPALLGVGILAATHRRFAFSRTSYVLIAVFLCLHAYGAKHGYAHTPAGDWAKAAFGLDRNYFDRAVHCAFGLLFAYPIREMLLRRSGVGRAAAGWLAWALVLAVSSVFEVAESLIAETVSPGAGPDWLGAQGDEWDAQQDMLIATAGAGFAMLVTWWCERGRWPESAPPPAENTRPFRTRRLLHVLCALYAAVWIVAAIRPVSREDWLLENILVFISLPFLTLTYRRRPLSDVSYVLLFVFFLLHAAGAHYTYSEVPFGYWLRDMLGLTRNHFDRIVHFSWGLLITYPLRDLTRFARLRPFWSVFLPAAVIIAWSGMYELIEATVAWLVSPELGQAYLGTQGDMWDGQWDMGLALLGAVLTSIITLLAEARRRR